MGKRGLKFVQGGEERCHQDEYEEGVEESEDDSSERRSNNRDETNENKSTGEDLLKVKAQGE